MDKFFKKIDFEITEDSNEEYHSKKEYISASGLKLIKKSPLHFKEVEKTETDAMKFGSAYHTFILEPNKFEEEYYLFDDSEIYSILIGEGAKSPRATKKYKEWHEAQMRIAGQKKMIDRETYNQLSSMKKRLQSHRYAKSLITNGEPELSVYVEAKIFTGETVKIKIRPDFLKQKKRIISDLKTTSDASIMGFPNNAANFDYHIQAALYSDIMDKINGKGLGYDFFFIAQEKTIPFAFNVFRANPQFMGQGRYEYEMLLMLYAQCSADNFWPGYQCFTENRFGINELGLPPYSINEINYYIHKF